MKTNLLSQIWFMALVMGMLLHAQTYAQTNNYFGTSGALNAAVWSLDSIGPFNQNFVTTGGGIANFLNPADVTGASITVAGVNVRANVNFGTTSGTISNFGNGLVPIFIDSGFTLDLGSQNMSTSATAGYIKNGKGVLALAGNSYGGGFTLNEGTVILRGVNGLGSNTNNRLTINGGTIAANASRDLSDRYPQGIFINNHVTFGSTAGLASATASLTFNNTIHLASGNHNITHGNNANVSFLGAITGMGGIRYMRENPNHTGRFVVNGQNTYVGSTTLEHITIQSGVANPFGANPAVLNSQQVLANGATIIADSGFTLNHPNTGLFITTNGLTINNASHPASLVSPLFGGGQLTKTGNGILSVNNARNFSGNILLNQGALEPSDSALSIESIVQIDGGTTLNLNGFSNAMRAVTGNGVVTNSQTNEVTLGLYVNDTTVTFAGQIQNGLGLVNLFKKGNGTYVINSPQQFTGRTAVLEGALVLGGAMSSNHVVVERNAILRIQSNVTLQQLTLHKGAKLEVLNGFTLTIGQLFNCNVNAVLDIQGNIMYGTLAGIVYTGSGMRMAGREWPNTSPRLVQILPHAEVIHNANKTIPRLFYINGTFNAGTFNLSGRADSLYIGGIVKTANPNGLINVGSTATTFTGYDNANLFNPSLDTSSVFIFDANGNQVVNGAVIYHHLVVQNGGIKTPIGTLNISRSLTIRNVTTLNGATNRIGSVTTNLTMRDSSLLILGSTGTQPFMEGVYSFSNSATIQFTNNSTTNQTLRSGRIYPNIQVVGRNVVFPATGVTLLSGCSLRVFNGAAMFVSSQNGLFAPTNAAVLTNNATLIQLDSGSTVIYNRSASPAQTISVLNHPYHHLQIQGSGIKNLAGNLTVNGRLTLQSSTLNLGTHQLTLQHNPIVVNGMLNAKAATLNLMSDSLPSGMLLDNEVSVLNVFSKNRFVLNSALTILNNLTVYEANLFTNGFNMILNALTAQAVFEPNARLTINGGTVNLNNRPVIFKSSEAGTATLGQVTGLLQGSGNITVQRYIPARRAFRFLASAVSTNNGIANNWQQQTHITGNGGLVNGFDPTNTNNPSMFTLNPQLQQWIAVSNTNTEQLQQGVGYRLLIRGDRSIDLSNNQSAPTPVVISATGTHIAGDKTYNSQSNPALAVGINHYTLLGNPFHSAVNWQTVTKQDVSPVLHKWRANGGSNNRGLYVSFNAISGISSDNIANRYIGAGYAFMVRTTGPNPQITIKESDKVEKLQPSVILGKSSAFNGIRLSLYEHDTAYADGLVLFEHENAQATYDDYDSDKWLNPGVSVFTKSLNGFNLAVNSTNSLAANAEIPLYFNNAETKQYTFTADEVAHSQLNFWLKDALLNTYTSLFNGSKYSFQVIASDSKTYANRFSVVTDLPTTAVQSLSNHMAAAVFPNPVVNALNIYFAVPISQTNITVYNTTGQIIYQTTVNNCSNMQVDTQPWLPGVYLVSIQGANGFDKTVKIVK